MENRQPKRPKGGSYPGERRGGRVVGSENKATKARKDILKALAHEDTRAALGDLIKGEILGPETPQQRKAIEHLAEVMEMLARLVKEYGPGAGRTFNEDKFFKYLDYALECARALAPFQSPTFKAIAVTTTGRSDGHVRLAQILNEIDQKSRNQPLMLSQSGNVV